MSVQGSPPPPPAPDIAGASNQEPKPWYGRWWAITGFVVLGLVVLLVVFVAFGSPDDEPLAAPSPSPSAMPSPASSRGTESPTEATETREPETPTAATAAPEPPATSSAASEAPDPDEPASEPGSEPGSRDDPLAVGDMGTLSEWEVTVDEINLDATQEMLDANQFNDEPANGNYGLVTLTATYTGAEEGDAGFMLGTTLSGADRRQYADTDCLATEPNSMFDQPTVENGGTVTGQFCLDFPDEALGDGAILFVDETISFTDERVFWSLPTS